MASARGPKKELGQHWLRDPEILAEIAEAAELGKSDVVLEIGPGLGTLTSRLLARAQRVVAVEFDGDLARKLPGQFPGKNLEVINEDILQFDLNQLPKGYKVVANVPYYITSKIVEKLMAAENKPSLAVLLVQKEVAQRIAAEPGEMSILAVSAQLFAQAELDIEVPRQFFTPPPKVDSQVVVLRSLDIQTRESIWKLLKDLQQKENMTVVLITHYLNEADDADKIYIVDHGQVIAHYEIGRASCRERV